MDGESAPETEVPRVEDEGAPAADEAGDSTQPKGGKKKRTWQKVNSLYNPAPYAAQKGASKGGKGGGKGGKGGPDGEGSPKGKGKGKDMYGEAEAQKMQEDPGRAPAGGEGPGPGSVDGDAAQAKGGARSKKQGGKSREGKGKSAGGKAPPGAQRKGCGGPGPGPGAPGPGPGPGAGPGLGPGPGAKGAPRGGAPGEAPEAGAESPEGPRPPGPQRGPAPGKGGAGQGVPGVPVAMAPYGYGAAVPYPYGAAAVPYPCGGVPAMYAMPYYLMPSPATPLNTGSSPYMPGAGGGPAPPQPNSADRQNLKGQVQQQIEYYFGRENMIKDVYLRSRLMNEEGWVQIAPLANFRRIQSMTTDMAVIMDAIASSQKLEMDPQGQHVRLKNNWQEWVLPNQGGKAPAPAPGAGARGA